LAPVTEWTTMTIREAEPFSIPEVDAASSAPDAFASVFATERAFDAWYERVLARVYGYVFVRAGRDTALAEDLTQQSFIEAVQAHDRYDGRADPLSWVVGIARHKLADHFRPLDAEERQRLRLYERLAPAPTTTVEAEVAEREAIASALATLPAMQRAVLAFAAFDGLTCRQIGDLVGLNEGAVESLLHRARVSFRRAYGISEGRDDA
jgi:RNA polymerase sigma-70 factor (ECF subfamily)